MITSATRLHRYPNGFELLLVPNRAAPAVALDLWVRVGSADEAPHQAGISHLVEHMLFKGTPRRPAGVMAREIEAVGGEINACTSCDHTVFNAVVASRYTELALDVLSDAVLCSVFDPTELHREQEVVLDEIRRGEDLPQQFLAEQLFGAAYSVHPYGRPVVGLAETVSSLDRDACREFVARWYRPWHMTLVAAGDIDTVALLATVGECFGSAPPGRRRNRPRRPREPARQAFHSVVAAREVSEIYLELAFPGPAAGHRDAPAVDLLAAVLGQGEASRLQQHLKLERNLVLGVGAGSWSPLDPGLFQVSAVVEAARAETAYAALCEQLFRLCRETVNRDELRRCRENLEADFVYQQETVEGQAQHAGHFHLLGGGAAAESAYLTALRQVEPEGLRAVARRYLRSTRGVLVGLHPADQAPPWTPEQLAATTRAAETKLRRRPRRRAGVVHLRRLANGVRVLVKENPQVPLVAVRAAVVGGLRCEPARRAGAFHLMSQALLGGTRRHGATEIARQVDSIGGQLDGFAGRSSWGLRGEFLAACLEDGLALFADVLCHPSFPSAEVAKAREDAQAALRLRRDDPAELAVQAFEKALYGDHPYGRDVLGSARTVAGLDDRFLRQFHRRVLRPDALVVAVVGDVEAGRVTEFLSTALADLELVAKPFALPQWPQPPIAAHQVEQRAPVAQAHLVLGYLGCRVHDPDRDALRVVSAMLSGQGGRLFHNLRETRGLGYAVDVIGTEGLDPGYLAAQVATAPERLEEARGALLDEFGQLAVGGFDPAEVKSAQRKLVGGFELGLQENASQAAQLALDEVYGLGGEAFRHYPADIFAVTPAQVAAAAARHLAVDSHVAALVVPGTETA